MLRILALLLLVAAGAGVRGTPALAQHDTNAAIERLFSEAAQEQWFAEAFLREVSLAQVEDIVGRLTDEFGELRKVAGSGETVVVHLQRAEVPARIRLDGSGRIATLLLEAPIPTAGSLADHVGTIAALPGETSVLVLTDGEVRAAHAPGAVLAVGSAAKLAILKALDLAVGRGALNWDDVVTFDPGWRSLPTGILQGWPAGTPLTLATLANLMISISDNTATDALIRIVGRGAVEAITPRNAPFLTTAEMFKLKADGNEALRREWLEAGEAGRRALLGRTDSLPAPTADELGEPTLEIEWFMSAEELCALLADVGDLPAMRINPGLADPAAWESVAFKGGFDTGALNFSTRLVGVGGAVHCVVATWNHEAVLDPERLSAPYRGILRVLAEGSGAASN